MDLPISDELREKLADGGFAKLATVMFNLPDLEGPTLMRHLGTKLAARRIQRRKVQSGLSALDAVLKSEPDSTP